MVKTSTVVAGIDTAKDTLDVAICGQALRLQVANSIRGWKQLRSDLVKAGVERIGIEATGGYERGVVRHLQAAGFIVIVLQPIRCGPLRACTARGPRMIRSTPL